MSKPENRAGRLGRLVLYFITPGLLPVAVVLWWYGVPVFYAVCVALTLATLMDVVHDILFG